MSPWSAGSSRVYESEDELDGSPGWVINDSEDSFVSISIEVDEDGNDSTGIS